jgi:hypothetical protein
MICFLEYFLPKVKAQTRASKKAVRLTSKGKEKEKEGNKRERRREQ